MFRFRKPCGIRLTRISRRVRRPCACIAYCARSLRARSVTSDASARDFDGCAVQQHIGIRTLKLEIVYQRLLLRLSDSSHRFCWASFRSLRFWCIFVNGCACCFRSFRRHIGGYGALLSIRMCGTVGEDLRHKNIFPAIVNEWSGNCCLLFVADQQQLCLGQNKPTSEAAVPAEPLAGRRCRNTAVTTDWLLELRHPALYSSLSSSSTTITLNCLARLDTYTSPVFCSVSTDSSPAGHKLLQLTHNELQGLTPSVKMVLEATMIVYVYLYLALDLSRPPHHMMKASLTPSPTVSTTANPAETATTSPHAGKRNATPPTSSSTAKRNQTRNPPSA